jgi:hypothetical protein
MIMRSAVLFASMIQRTAAYLLPPSMRSFCPVSWSRRRQPAGRSFPMLAEPVAGLGDCPAVAVEVVLFDELIAHRDEVRPRLCKT